MLQAAPLPHNRPLIVKKGVLGQTFTHFADICKFEAKILSIQEKQRRQICKNKCYVLMPSSLPAPVDLSFFLMICYFQVLSWGEVHLAEVGRLVLELVLTCKVGCLTIIWSGLQQQLQNQFAKPPRLLHQHCYSTIYISSYIGYSQCALYCVVTMWS